MKPYIITEPLCTDDLVVMTLMSLEKNMETLCKLEDISQPRLNELMDYANRLASFVDWKGMEMIELGKEYRTASPILPTNTAEHAADWALVEVLPEVTVRREVLFWDYDGGRVITGRPGDAGPGDIVLGTIAITHNGKEITDVRVVK